MMFRLLKKMPWPETQTHKCKQTSARLNDRLSCSHVPCFETVPANVLQREGTGKSRSIRTFTEYVATHPLHDAQLALHYGPKKKSSDIPQKKPGPRPLTYINQNTQRASPEGIKPFKHFRSSVLNTLPKGYLCYRKPGMKLQEPWANKATTRRAGCAWC